MCYKYIKYQDCISLFSVLTIFLLKHIKKIITQRSFCDHPRKYQLLRDFKSKHLHFEILNYALHYPLKTWIPTIVGPL